MTKESIEKERCTMEELQNHLNTQMEAANSSKQEYTEEKDEPFDPHGYEERLL